MVSLEYSNEALSAKGLFYNKLITVYVEGKDDPIFWQNLFNLGEIKAYIEDVGGRKQLEKYCNKIIQEHADFYVATDNDNSEFFPDAFIHPNIIRTYGYSIENSMYYSSIPIEKTVSNFCRKRLDLSVDFKNWVDQFSKEVYTLIVYDIANNRFKKGISIFGDNCYRFLKRNNSHKICETKVMQFIDSVKDQFKEEEIIEVMDLIQQSEKELWFMIKGHFITHALINLIKYSVRKYSGDSNSMNSDFLYSITVDCKEGWEERIDIKTVIDQIRKIKNRN